MNKTETKTKKGNLTLTNVYVNSIQVKSSNLSLIIIPLLTNILTTNNQLYFSINDNEEKDESERK